MNGDRSVEVPFGCTHFDRHREALQQLITARTDDVNADDSLLLTDYNELDRHLHFARGEGVIHRRECGLVDLHLICAIRGNRFCFGWTNGADWRMTEHDGG